MALPQCGIDTDGQCVSLGTSGADSSADVLMSSSSVATYCDPHESVCQNCKDTVCMGSDGCVCMAMCQVSSWEEHVLQVDGCIGSSASGSNGMTTSTIANTLPVILMIGLAGFVLFGGTILVIRRLPRNTAQGTVAWNCVWSVGCRALGLICSASSSLETTENEAAATGDAHRSCASAQCLARRPWEAGERRSDPNPRLGLPSNRRRGTHHPSDGLAPHAASTVAQLSTDAAGRQPASLRNL